MPLDSYDRDVSGLFGVDTEVRALWPGGGWLEGQTWLPASDGLPECLNDRQSAVPLPN
ncbi:hypothetical protein [Roseobacter sp. GAI101]|uniref:hypothetical protein n=1 Tax=Roseobacter sp. (strain GAI101) TaxID=391589 RepID=UPI00018725E3|nr:hypothetical protein [Roseobacter sp. GAI101]EEB84088.1 hypothetical protein RGAI101_1238 [Roseobacter sp. GAI101]